MLPICHRRQGAGQVHGSVKIIYLMKPSILIVESDDGTYRGIMQGLPEHYATLRARNSSEALEMVRNNSGIDVLLCDLGVPEAGDRDAVQIIRSEFKDIPMIVIGSHACARQVCEAMRHGASTFILKPLDLPHLEQVVESALRKRRTPPPGAL